MYSKETYFDMAIKTFVAQEKDTKEEYFRRFNILAEYLCNSLGIHNLYRYRPDDQWIRDKNIFENDKIWFQPMSKQNDPLECSFNIDYNNPLDPFLALCPSLYPLKLYTHLLMKEFEEYKDKCLIACFSETYDNTLLWSNYARSHQGYCISYSSLEILLTFQCFLLPVIYQEAIPSLSDTLLYAENIGVPAAFCIAYKRISTKLTKWNKEKEWRIIHTLQSNDGNGAAFQFPKPTAVYLGYQSNQIFEYEMKQMCVKKNIPVFKMEVDKTTDTLYPRLIS